MKTAEEWVREFLAERNIHKVAENEPRNSITMQLLGELIPRIQADAAASAIRSRPPLEAFQLGEVELREMEERLKAISHGEWTQDGHNVYEGETPVATAIRGRRDAAVLVFIAHAHQDVPHLIHDLRTAWQMIDDYNQDRAADRIEEVRRKAYEAGRRDAESALYGKSRNQTLDEADRGSWGVLDL